MKYNIKVRDLPVNERPREKLLRYGAEYLSNAELLALILRTGTKEENVLTMCNSIIAESGGINGLLNLSVEEVEKIRGIGSAKAAQIIALSEIYSRIHSIKSGMDIIITCPKDVANFLMNDMKGLAREHFKLIMLDTKNKVICIKTISIGDLNSSVVHPREVFVEAIKKSCASVIVCHNHPSGDPTPSREDINVTKRLKECGTILGIEVLDHIIIGKEKYVSLKEKGIV